MIGNYLNFRDMIDGSGAGASGPEFEGGPLSGLLNRIGVKPAGYRDRMSQQEAARPMARPSEPARPEMVYSGRGEYGMPDIPQVVPTKDWGGYGDALAAIIAANRPMEYSGRGYVGMPMEPFYADDPYNGLVLQYLREKGMANY